ncbi:MAG: hypothetical protein HQM05_17145 [Magnetococcales bacterium]|nr:hypothetical protein [Magnetococcales bacterium]
MKLTATTLSAQSEAGNISLNLEGSTTLVRQGVVVTNSGDLKLQVTGNLSMETAAALRTSSGQTQVTVTGTSALSTLASTSGTITVTSGGAVTLASVTSNTGSFALTSQDLLLNGTGINVAGSGSVTITANGALAMADGSAIVTAAGATILNSKGAATTLTTLSSTTGNITVSADGVVALANMTSSDGSLILTGKSAFTLNGAGINLYGSGSVILTANGAISMDDGSAITSATGSITISNKEAAGAGLVLTAIASTGGDVTIHSGGTVTLHGTGINAGDGGMVTISANGGVTMQDGSAIQSASGEINLKTKAAGALTMGSTSVISSASGNIIADVAGNATVSIIQSTTGNLTVGAQDLTLSGPGLQTGGEGRIIVMASGNLSVGSTSQIATVDGDITVQVTGHSDADMSSVVYSTTGNIVLNTGDLTLKSMTNQEGLRVTGGRTITFNDRVYIDGDLSITATESVIFTDQVILRAGGHLFINGAAQVQFFGGLYAEASTDPILVLTGTNSSVDFVHGLLVGGDDAVHFGGVQRLELGTPASGQTAPNLKVSGGALSMTEVANSAQMQLTVATLALSGTTLTFSPLGEVPQHVTAGDVRLTAALGIGSALAPLQAKATTLSAQTTAGNIHLKLEGDTTLVRQGVMVDSIGNLGLTVTGNLSMETAAVLRTSTGQLEVNVSGTSHLTTLSSTTGDLIVTSGGAVALSTATSRTGDITVRSQGAVAVSAMTSTTGDMTVSAAGAVVLSGVTSTTGSLAVTSKALTLDGTGIRLGGSGKVTIHADGAITLKDGSAIRTIAGEINLSDTDTAPLTMASSSDISTVSGTISINLAGNAGVSIIKSTTGDITLGTRDLTLNGVGLQTGGWGKISTASSGELFMSSGSHIMTDSGAVSATSIGNMQVSLIKSDGGSITLGAATLTLRDSGVFVHQGSGAVTVNVTEDWLMDAKSSVVTHAGTITIEAGGLIQVSRLLSETGDVALDSGKSVVVVGSVLAPQIQTAGNLSVNADEGIGGYGFDRLYVDVNAVTGHNRVSGDVLISGWKGLQVGAAGVHSDSDKGWLVLMSGVTGLVKKAGVVGVSAANGQTACISGVSMILPGVLAGRSMQGFDGYITQQTSQNTAVSEVNALDAFNARLAQEWSRQVEGGSTVDRFDAASKDLSSAMQRLSDSKIAAFASTVVDVPESPHNIAALLLDAALQKAQNQQQGEMFGTALLSNWAQSPSAVRSEPVRGNNAMQSQPEPPQSESARSGPVQAKSVDKSNAKETTEPADTATEPVKSNLVHPGSIGKINVRETTEPADTATEPVKSNPVQAESVGKSNAREVIEPNDTATEGSQE